MHITKLQKDLLTSLQTSYTTGLTEQQTSTLRNKRPQKQRQNSTSSTTTAIDNKLTPPINCPSWACVLLPCINHLPSVKLFKLVQPHDAEVLRDSRWVFYDAPGLMVGDIVRLNEGDIVPADCTVLSLGMDHCEADGAADGGGDGDGGDEVTELVVDARNVTGEVRPKSIALSRSNNDGGGSGNGCTTLPVGSEVELYCGSHVLEGSAIAVVTQIGSDTCLARWIREGKWPPTKKVRNGDDDGMESLITNGGGGADMEMEEEGGQQRNIV